MSERRVASGLQRLMFAPRLDQSALGWPLSDESKELARAIRLVASPAPNVTSTDDHLLRVVVWVRVPTLVRSGLDHRGVSRGRSITVVIAAPARASG
jgi:hypothetical protein